MREVARSNGGAGIAQIVSLVLPAGGVLTGSGPVQREIDIPAAGRSGTSRRDVRDHPRRAGVVAVPSGVVIVVAKAPPFVVAATSRGVRVPDEHIPLARPVRDF